ncbi:MAG: hypothetical protein SF339_07235 [Blastocatellia bacterium]|nr:hypothetical protein [Blastocatellia bacterium]
MKKQKQTIECGRCGESRQEALTEAEVAVIRDAIGPIYRQCDRCEKTTGWIGGAPAPARSRKTPAPQRLQKEQKRMATQAERDTVDSMVRDRT